MELITLIAKLIACLIRAVQLNKNYVIIFIVTVVTFQVIISLSAILSKSNNDKTSEVIIDTDFLNKNAFNIKLNPDLNVILNVFETYIYCF